MKDWKATDATGRLKIIMENANDVPGRGSLIYRFHGKPQGELKAVFGEPDVAEKGSGDKMIWRYHLGASSEGKTLSWEIDRWGKVWGADFSWNP